MAGACASAGWTAPARAAAAVEATKARRGSRIILVNSITNDGDLPCLTVDGSRTQPRRWGNTMEQWPRGRGQEEPFRPVSRPLKAQRDCLPMILTSCAPFKNATISRINIAVSFFGRIHTHLSRTPRSGGTSPAPRRSGPPGCGQSPGDKWHSLDSSSTKSNRSAVACFAIFLLAAESSKGKTCG
jgi:hypothetical protein